MSLQLLFGTLFGFLASVGVCKTGVYQCHVKDIDKEIRTVQSGLVTTEDAIDLLAGFVDRATIKMLGPVR